ncbi:MAG TPA: response regulator [Blastocatellia bacterium]|nr:response regulator [Blastocatellia bacterium]
MTAQKKLLIVEDHQDTLAVYLLVLERKGYDIRLAWNGEEGLAKFNSWQPDLVVLDEMLPRLSGTEMLEKIREGGSTVPVIIVSGNNDPVVRQHCMKTLGAKDFLQKPLDFDALLARIEQIFEEQQ